MARGDQGGSGGENHAGAAGRAPALSGAPLPAHPDAAVLSVERVYDGKYKLDRVTFRSRRTDGSWSRARAWELWRRGRAVAILPYDPLTDRVALIEQFRLPALAAGLDPHLTELPAGFAEPGEDEAQAARRETREETGLAVGRVEHLGGVLLSPGGSDEFCDVFLGEVALPTEGTLGTFGLASEAEDIVARALPTAEAVASAAAGIYKNVVTTVGLLWFSARKEFFRAAWQGRGA